MLTFKATVLAISIGCFSASTYSQGTNKGSLKDHHDAALVVAAYKGAKEFAWCVPAYELAAEMSKVSGDPDWVSHEKNVRNIIDRFKPALINAGVITEQEFEVNVGLRRIGLMADVRLMKREDVAQALRKCNASLLDLARRDGR